MYQCCVFVVCVVFFFWIGCHLRFFNFVWMGPALGGIQALMDTERESGTEQRDAGLPLPLHVIHHLTSYLLYFFIYFYLLYLFKYLYMHICIYNLPSLHFLTILASVCGTRLGKGASCVCTTMDAWPRTWPHGGCCKKRCGRPMPSTQLTVLQAPAQRHDTVVVM